MAAKGAHITQNSIEARPSIFEVVAADSLNATFYPALKRIANFLATIKPNTFGVLVRYYDEVYLLFNWIVQSYYLRHKGGSLSEVFYGLTRISSRTQILDRTGQRWSWVTLVIAPYVVRKVEQRLQQWKDDYEAGKPVEGSKLLLTRVMPYLKACFECARLLQYVTYLAGSGSTHSPVLRVLNLKLTYLAEEDQSWTIREFLGGQVKIATLLSTVMLRTLELSAFFLQFIEWWQNEANMGDLSKLPIPNAPPSDLNSAKYKGICPICLQRWVIPTAISISGYVYCYSCIVAHLQKENKCLVTKYPATVNDLVRIFDDI
ncbi:peroxisome assembly protein 12-A [Armigeres subalbatus]|uniref:peroxisome assembly protein 12-A n=1 Tax=Armigeres subalbatus TaxID=124917 RepID=UPI002ED40926